MYAKTEGVSIITNLSLYLYNCNLSALRICLIALKADLHPEPSWPALQERCQNNPQIPFQILVKHRSK
ncbi:MAG: hypothetical protein KA191_06330 [Verrucomicrobia bacterium]|nr:hypothetical protein [Verrucomicrobiota bacterium]OQC65823.1 MAG: hypothetical protein BWX48_02178 [Verrucomicrobia bacterium ADurb.Bin006]